MTVLHKLKDTTRPRKNSKRVGRGTGSGCGKTCSRGHKGEGARAGSVQRHGYEGGQLPLYRKLPTRGFSNARFQKRLTSINLREIEKFFSDGEIVNEESLRKHGFLTGKCHGVKVLGNGEITKKVIVQVDSISSGAREKLEKAGIEIKELTDI